MCIKYYSILILSFVVSCQVQEPDHFSFEPVSSPGNENSQLPYLVTGNDGHLYLSWIEQMNNSQYGFYFSKWGNDSWQEKKLIATGSDWFVNWADYPMIAVDKSGNMLAHLLVKSGSGTFSYDIHVYSKNAIEEEWKGPFLPHTDSTQTEHGFVTMLPNDDGTFLLAWLDGRKTIDAVSDDDHNHHGGNMTLRTAKMDLDGNLTEEHELDNRVCDCCQTTGVMTSTGPIVAYRNRDWMETRDIFSIKSLDGKWQLTKPVYEDQWTIAACPVNGPRMDAFQKSVVIAWYTAANGQPTVRVAFSSDGGENFQQPILIDNTQPIGRVDIAQLDEKTAFVTWLDQDEDNTAIKGMQLWANGKVSFPVNISESNPSRGTGFPQIARLNNQLFVAWTHLDGHSKTIKVAKASIY